MKMIFTPIVMAVALLTSGCLSLTSYVDPALGEVPAAERVAVADPQPVQFLFEFQTKGTANARATRQLHDQAFEIVSNSGLFSEVSSEPVESGALLSVTMNNIPQEDAAGRGFTTGLTLGLAGTTVSDFYVGTARFVSGPGATEIAAEERHALHSTLGNTDAPQNLTPAASPLEGVNTILRQLMEHLLFDVARDPAFTPAPADETAPEA